MGLSVVWRVVSVALACGVCVGKSASPGLGRSASPGLPGETTPAPGDWPADASNFPDPQIDVDRCRIDGRTGYVCDPDRLLTAEQGTVSR